MVARNDDFYSNDSFVGVDLADAVAGQQPDARDVDVGENPHPIELALVDPRGVREGRVVEDGLHRLDAVALGETEGEPFEERAGTKALAQGFTAE